MSYPIGKLPQDHEILNQFLCIALGCNSYLHPYIDECYQKNEREYYEAYRKSGQKGNPLFSMYTTKNEEKIRKVAGIIEWCATSKKFAPLDQLIKKGYKFAYQYSQRQTHMDFEKFMRSFAKRHKNKIMKEIELIYQNIVLWYLCVREHKPINTRNIAWQSFQKVLRSSINEIPLQKSLFSSEMVEKHNEEIDQLYEEYNIPKKPNFESLGVFLEYLLSENVKRIVETAPHCGTEQAEEQVFKDTPGKFIGALGGWLKALNIHEMDATEKTPMTKKDLDMAFLEMVYAKKYNSISKEEQDLFFISCLYLKCLSSQYHETKQLYLSQSNLDHYQEMKWKESQINEQKADLFKRKQEWQLTVKRKQKEIDGLSQELREAQVKIRQLEQQIEEMEDYSEEVHALRDYVFRDEQNDGHFSKTPSIEIMKEYIQSKKIFIFGGYPIWQQKLKAFLPNAEFVDVSLLNRDISKIQRVDAVFINTAVFSHAFYKKIMKELSRTGTPLFYLNGQSNVEKTTVEIYKWMTE